MSIQTSARSVSLTRRLLLLLLIVCGVAFALVAGYVAFLSTSLALPKSDEHPPLLIYGAPFFLTPGLHAVDSGLLEHLQRLEYKPTTAAPRVAGEYFATKDSIEIFLHAQEEARLPARSVRLKLANGLVTEVLSVSDGHPLSLVSLEPVLISGMRSGSRQVREWIPLDRIPPALIKTLLTVEDRRFFSHFGVDPIAIARAFWIDMTRGALVQGGSTLTQQLAKNLYYSPKRTIGRKLQEVMAAMALEFKYRKEEILESYVNEIYLGQAGPVSIYGVGEAPIATSARILAICQSTKSH